MDPLQNYRLASETAKTSESSDPLVSLLKDTQPPQQYPMLPMSARYPERARLVSPGRRRLDLQSIWFWEILCFAFAGGLYGVFFYLLVKFDTQLVARWEQDTPETIL